jgi:hypothetical protein
MTRLSWRGKGVVFEYLGIMGNDLAFLDGWEFQFLIPPNFFV